MIPFPAPAAPPAPAAAAPAPPPARPAVDTVALPLALDRIAAELLKLPGGFHLLILVDRSRSMTDDVRACARQLGRSLDDLVTRRSVRLRLAFYDSQCRLATGWLADVAAAARALADARMDGDGSERPVRAVEALGPAFPANAENRIVLIMTDESGVDADRLEKAIAAARARGLRVFVLGHESPFGWPFRHETAASGRCVTTDAGPESPRVEILQVSPVAFGVCCSRHAPFCRKFACYPGLRLDATDAENPLACDLGFDGAVGSGFGPWALERLARETGGRFFLLRGSPFDEAAMRPYAPDLLSRAEYTKAAKDPLRAAVLRAVDAWPPAAADGDVQHHTVLPYVVERFGRDDARRAALDIARRCRDQIAALDVAVGDGGADRVGPRHGAAGGAAKAGPRDVSAEAPGAKADGAAPPGEATRLRWRAHADLIRGQLAALRHYAWQYAMAVAAWPDEQAPRLALAPGPRRASAAADAIHAEARERLDAVARAYAGTPWAATASRLLDRLGGFTLVEPGPCAARGKF